jgi:proteasome lid subunit RPN8/RPN11
MEYSNSQQSKYFSTSRRPIEKKTIIIPIIYDEFIECVNMHPDPVNYFLISPKECIFDDDVVLFHSHPAHSNLVGFSDWDLKNQEYFYLKMIVYSVNNNEFYYKSI